MEKQTEKFSRNDKYLIAEYQKYADGDYLLMDIGDKTFVVPLKYTLGAKDGFEAVARFRDALLDFLSDDEKKLIFDPTKQNNKRVKEISEKLEVKYHAVINAHRTLNIPQLTDFSAAALEKNTYKILKQGQPFCVSPNAEEQLKIYRFLCEKADKVSANMKTKVAKLAKSLGEKIIKTEYLNLKKYKPKHWRMALLAGAMAVSGYHMYNGLKDKLEPKPEVETVSKKDTIPTFTDFMGNVHNDEYGNLKRMSDLQPEIMAMILAVEGYAEEAFLEGGAHPTKGSGFTVTINEDGSVSKVKMGDKTTQDEDIINNQRFIEKSFIDLLSDSVDRPLSSAEIKACICAGYCWGADAFSKSSFFKSIRDNERIEEQSRKISGFRKQLGLLKRGFLISQILNGNWSAEDLLDLPVYQYKDKGFVFCSVYALQLHDCLPCKKDKNGKYLKDKKGNDVPIVCADDFCMNFYSDKDKKILHKLIEDAKNSGYNYKTVRELMKDDMVDSIINKEDKVEYEPEDKLFFAQLYQQVQKANRS